MYCTTVGKRYEKISVPPQKEREKEDTYGAKTNTSTKIIKSSRLASFFLSSFFFFFFFHDVPAKG